MINHTVKLIGKLLNNKIFRVSLLLLILTYPFYSEFRFYLATGDSMLPTYENGELVVIYRTKALGEDWRPARGQVIIAGDEEDGGNIIKRVVAVEGEYVRIKHGRIFINNKKYTDPWTHQDITYWTEPVEVQALKPRGEWLFLNTDQDVGVVPEGYVWVIGDNRNESWLGLVKIEDIKGWVLF